MDKSNRNKCWLGAAYLTLCLLFSFSTIAQVAVRAPASATPGNIAVFGASPNLIIDGGSPSGSGIAIQAGAGNANILTNLTATAYSNSLGGVKGGVMATNDTDPTHLLNSTTNFYWDLFGNTSNNNEGIEWTSPEGWLGEIIEQPNHDGNPEGPARSEFTILSANNVTIIPNDLQTGNNGKFQLGGVGIASWDLINVASNTAIQGGTMLSAPSQPLFFRTWADSNAVLHELDPGFCADWPKSNIWEGHFYIFGDSGTYGGLGPMPDKNLEVRHADFRLGTNAQGNYSGETFFGRLGGNVVTMLQVETNGIGISNNMSDLNYTGDTWAAPENFTAGGTSAGGFALSAGSASVFIGTASFPEFGVFNGGGGYANSLMLVGGGFGAGAGFRLPVSIGTNGISSGDDLQLRGNGRALIYTNTATLGFTSNLTISGLGTQFFTNNLGAQVLFKCNIQATALAGLAASTGYVATKNGVNSPSTEVYGIPQEASSANAKIGIALSDILGPGDYVNFSTNAGSGCSIIITNCQMTVF